MPAVSMQGPAAPCVLPCALVGQSKIRPHPGHDGRIVEIGAPVMFLADGTAQIDLAQLAGGLSERLRPITRIDRWIMLERAVAAVVEGEHSVDDRQGLTIGAVDRQSVVV